MDRVFPHPAAGRSWLTWLLARTPKRSTRTVLTRYVTAARSGHRARAARLFAADAVHRDVAFDVRTIGAGPRCALFHRTFESLDGLTLTIHSCLVDREHAVLEWTTAGRQVRPLIDRPGTGRQVVIRGVSMLTVSSGRIVSVTDYVDRAALERQLRF